MPFLALALIACFKDVVMFLQVLISHILMYVFWLPTILPIGFYLQASEEIQINSYYSFFDFVIA